MKNTSRIILDNYVFQSTPTISGTAYSTGDNVGGLITLDAAVPVDGNATLEAISVLDVDAQDNEIDFFFFSAEPTASTITDNSAISIDSTDALSLIGCITVESTDYKSIGTPSFAHKHDEFLNLNGDATFGDTERDVYVVMVERGAPTRTDGNLTVSFHITWVGE